jgi:uncharacterized protein (DUF2141 family)
VRTLILFLVATAISACGGRSTAAHPVPSARGKPGEIEIVLTGFRNNVGQARLVVFLSADGFPEDSKRAARSGQAGIVGRKAVVKFASVPAGRFAVAVLHDEDGDAAMKKNFLGVPQEGFGFSRNPHIGLSAPDFDECAVELPPGGSVRVEIKMIYM